MTSIQPISERVAVGGQPSADELEELRRQGFAAVVNLRLDGEPSQVLSPAAEGEAAAAAGLAYHHLPVSTGALDAALIDRLRATIAAAAGPVYVHCGAGQRACSLSLLATAEARAAPTDPIAQAERLGFPITDPHLAAFVREQSERHPVRLLQAI